MLLPSARLPPLHNHRLPPSVETKFFPTPYMLNIDFGAWQTAEGVVTACFPSLVSANGAKARGNKKLSLKLLRPIYRHVPWVIPIFNLVLMHISETAAEPGSAGNFAALHTV